MAYDRPAAPDALGTIEAFCNSARFLYDEDAFLTVDGTARWLREHGRSAVGLDDRKRQQLVRLREAIREHVESGQESGTLNEFARKVLGPPRWDDAGNAEIPVNGESVVDRLAGELLSVLFVEELTGRRGRLKVCRSGDCRWLFYDRSPANNSVWCSMSICGARHKMRSYRKRAEGK
ncbi:putative RNA-binding Zn ribbon-like protein [Saccharopolyspora erythraea NRRL 2338]|uniref:Uncharacterized protein n=2 Tax=Saccharopolyspora erythraea TaxID=1836 RepID=A4FK08_SACEN|nr:CGNR zinc finger domain-containing protein [Saccharopolyspora erythraea]EQD86965.1 hypothetical protein N599_06540 [Saccharopolyspora erythraea D]PFG98021.1 putative RNA-binding Zn ribbon-like protein [Saccharopolyspora erythraea NRRL 2338]QRK88141.1 CGNR zinc finger domain-containing protein [Saccharopolyspora erythraea]CAM04383.1 hypothetical protein SACE_5138 [Saccharopolyspora erythraea NRRL 2338]